MCRPCCVLLRASTHPQESPSVPHVKAGTYLVFSRFVLHYCRRSPWWTIHIPSSIHVPLPLLDFSMMFLLEKFVCHSLEHHLFHQNLDNCLNSFFFMRELWYFCFDPATDGPAVSLFAACFLPSASLLYKNLRHKIQKIQKLRDCPLILQKHTKRRLKVMDISETCNKVEAETK